MVENVDCSLDQLDIAQVKHLKLVVVAFVQAVWVADTGEHS